MPTSDVPYAGTRLQDEDIFEENRRPMKSIFEENTPQIQGTPPQTYYQTATSATFTQGLANSALNSVFGQLQGPPHAYSFADELAKVEQDLINRIGIKAEYQHQMNRAAKQLAKDLEKHALEGPKK